MSHRYHDLLFTDEVRKLQDGMGSRRSYARLEGGEARNDRLGPDETAFIASRESFYIASVGATGWPYIQHRGGPAGFLTVLDERTIGFADFAGNRQYITTGNLAAESRVSLFLMDYARRGRLKLLGRARPIGLGEDPELIARLTPPDYKARVERAMVIAVEAFDWNCSQHIVERYTLAELEPAIGALRGEITRLGEELAQARSELTAARADASARAPIVA